MKLRKLFAALTAAVAAITMLAAVPAYADNDKTVAAPTPAPAPVYTITGSGASNASYGSTTAGTTVTVTVPYGTVISRYDVDANGNSKYMGNYYYGNSNSFTMPENNVRLESSSYTYSTYYPYYYYSTYRPYYSSYYYPYYYDSYYYNYYNYYSPYYYTWSPYRYYSGYDINYVNYYNLARAGVSNAKEAAIYVVDSNMKTITTVREELDTRNDTLEINLGSAYAGASVSLYEGKKSTAKLIDKSNLTSKGRINVSVVRGHSYTVVVD